jgi:hypothetical protein
MKKNIISVSRIVAAIKELELRKKVEKICRALGMNKATFCNWKKSIQEWTNSNFANKIAGHYVKELSGQFHQNIHCFLPFVGIKL